MASAWVKSRRGKRRITRANIVGSNTSFPRRREPKFAATTTDAHRSDYLEDLGSRLRGNDGLQVCGGIDV